MTQTERSELRPVEYVLGPGTAAALAAVLGVPVPGAGQLPAGQSPLEHLREQGLLVDGADLVQEELSRALTIIAHPTAAVTVATAIPEQQSWSRLIAWCSGEAEGFAAVNSGGGATVLALYPRAADLAVAVGSTLHLAESPPTEAETFRFSLAGWSALLAIADLATQRENGNLMARERARPNDSFVAGQLAEVARQGGETEDLRWLCTLGRAFSPVALLTDAPAMTRGLDQLWMAGIVQSAEAGYRVAPEGSRLVLALRSVMVAGAFSATRVRAAGEETVVAGVLSSLVGAWAVVWEAVEDGETLVALVPTNLSGLLGLLGRLAMFAREPAPAGVAQAPPRALEPPGVPTAPRAAPAAPIAGVCSACGGQLVPDAKFCGTCGQRVEARLPGVCPACGYQSRPESRFCGKCGQPVA